jgi:beta-lactamase superfamily II metal-dependent hydrolase
MGILTSTPTDRHSIRRVNGDNQGNRNQNSIVVRLDLGPTRVLFMGDSDAGGRKPPLPAPSPTSIEGTLLACCTSDLAANVLIVAHNGSRSSSRKAFLDAVASSVAVVSSGPKAYSGVKLPDDDIIMELNEACKTSPKKVGPDNDGQPGGCDSVRIAITGTMIQP